MPRKSSNLLKRRLKIAEIVAAQGEIKVDDLSAQLGVSGVTIRGDLSYLEQQGYLKRSFGGAIATPLSSEPEAIQPIAPLSLAQQMEIARHCARLIRDRDTLFLGHGTICRKIIPLLSEVKKLRLITNDPEHALLANQFIDGEIILAGSEMLRPDTALAGKPLEQALQHFTITHSILEISHLDADGTLNINVPRLAAAWHSLSNSYRRLRPRRTVRRFSRNSIRRSNPGRCYCESFARRSPGGSAPRRSDGGTWRWCPAHRRCSSAEYPP